MRASASKVVVEPDSQKSRSQPRASPVCVDKLQGHWGELVPEGATADPGSEFPVSSLREHQGHLHVHTWHRASLGVKRETGLQLAADSPGYPEWTERSPVVIHEGDASCD